MSKQPIILSEEIIRLPFVVPGRNDEALMVRLMGVEVVGRDVSSRAERENASATDAPAARAGARRARKPTGDHPRSGRTRRPPLHRILYRDHPQP
jgi:hypothetical protein